MAYFLRIYDSSAVWLFLTLIVGLMVACVWAWRFRALRRTEIPADELRAEAWRGVLGGGAWLSLLVWQFVIMVTRSEMYCFEAMAVSDHVSRGLTWSAEQETRSAIHGAVFAFGFAGATLIVAGWISGAVDVLGRTADHGRGRKGHHA